MLSQARVEQEVGVGLISEHLQAGGARAAERREHLTTKEAADHLRKSESWLLKRNDIPFLKGVPNTYRRADLDAWVERNLTRPRIERG